MHDNSFIIILKKILSAQALQHKYWGHVVYTACKDAIYFYVRASLGDAWEGEVGLKHP